MSIRLLITIMVRILDESEIKIMKITKVIDDPCNSRYLTHDAPWLYCFTKGAAKRNGVVSPFLSQNRLVGNPQEFWLISGLNHISSHLTQLPALMCVGSQGIKFHARFPFEGWAGRGINISPHVYGISLTKNERLNNLGIQYDWEYILGFQYIKYLWGIRAHDRRFFYSVRVICLFSGLRREWSRLQRCPRAVSHGGGGDLENP